MPLLGISQAKFGGNSVAAARASLKNSNTYTLTYIDGIFYLVSTTTSYPIAFSTVGATGTGNLVYSNGATLTGTTNISLLNFATQSSAPSTPANGFTLYSNNSGLLSWKGTNGFVRTLDGSSNTADRTYTLPNANGTFGLLENANTWSSTNTFTGNLRMNHVYILNDGVLSGLVGRRSFWTGGETNNDLAIAAYEPNISFFTNGSTTERMKIDASGNLGIGGTANANAILDLQSTTKAFKLPVMTSTQASTITASAGFMVYVTDTNGTFTSVGFWGYTTSWQKLNN